MAGHPGHDQSLGFHGLGIGLAAPERQPQRPAERMGRSLVIGVGMGQCVCEQSPSANLSEDPPRCESRPGVHQHTTHQVDVEPEGRKPSQQFQVLGDASHRLDPTPRPRLVLPVKSYTGVSGLCRSFTVHREQGNHPVRYVGDEPGGIWKHRGSEDQEPGALASTVVAAEQALGQVGDQVARARLLGGAQAQADESVDRGRSRSRLVGGREFLE